MVWHVTMTSAGSVLAAPLLQHKVQVSACFSCTAQWQQHMLDGLHTEQRLGCMVKLANMHETSGTMLLYPAASFSLCYVGQYDHCDMQPGAEADHAAPCSQELHQAQSYSCSQSQNPAPNPLNLRRTQIQITGCSPAGTWRWPSLAPCACLQLTQPHEG